MRKSNRKYYKSVAERLRHSKDDRREGTSGKKPQKVEGCKDEDCDCSVGLCVPEMARSHNELTDLSNVT